MKILIHTVIMSILMITCDEKKADKKTENQSTTPSIKHLFDDEKAKTNKKDSFKKLVWEEIESGDWEEQAKTQILSHINRSRGAGGFFSRCNPKDIENNIKQAEEHDVTVLSNKIVVYLHYNINSYCGTNNKYKYYDAKFKVVFPIINERLEDGFFESKSITETE